MSKATGRKRARTLLDVIASVDDLLGVTPKYDYNESSDDQSENAESGGEADVDETLATVVVAADSARTPHRHCGGDGKSGRAADVLDASPSSPLDSFLWENSGSLGGTELSLLNRKEEELADMAFFSVGTLQRVRTPVSLLALVQHFATHGVRPVLMALKHAGTQPRFFQMLCETPITGPLRRRVLRLFALLFAECDNRELFCCDAVVRFLVRCLEANTEEADAEGQSDETTGTTRSRTTEATHWSARSTPRRSGSGGVATSGPTPTAGGEAQVDALLDTLAKSATVASSDSEHTASSSPSSSSSPSFLCAVGLLTELVLAQNRHRSTESVPRLLAQAGGLDVLCARLEAAGPSTTSLPTTHATTTLAAEDCLPVLSLLEVLTVSTGFPRGPESSLPRLMCRVLDVLHGAAPATALAASFFTSPSSSRLPDSPCALVVSACLRVLTNMTHIDAAVLRSGTAEARHAAQALARWLSALLTDARPVAPLHVETTTFALCCAVNLVRYEARYLRSAAASFTLALVWASVEQHTAAGADRVSSSSSRDLGDAAPMPLLTHLAVNMFACYLSEATEMTVLSGYYALLLAVVSLVRDDPDDVLALVAPLNLRVRVLTAVTTAARGTPMGMLAETTPMALVAVILQEFLVFQSTSGTLTREALVEMAAVVEQLVAANHIEVSTTEIGSSSLTDDGNAASEAP